MEINVRDIINDKIVVKVTNKYIFFEDNQKLSKKKLFNNKDLYKIIYNKSPNIDLDWANSIEVKNYYNSFTMYNTYMAVGDKPIKTVCVEIKDNIVFYDNEYYLPAPVNVWEGRNINYVKAIYADGKYNVLLYKKKNNWFSNDYEESLVLNLFDKPELLKENTSELKNKNNDLYARSYGTPITVTCTQDYIDGVTIDLNNIDLNLLFREYYLNKKQGYVNLIMSDDEINKLLIGLNNRIRKILESAIIEKKYKMIYSTDYGYFDFDYINFDITVGEKIFNIINSRLIKSAV